MKADALDDLPQRHRERLRSPEVLQRRLVREIDRSGTSKVLLSDESLFGSPDEELRGLSRFTHGIGRNLRLLAYVRRQDDHLASRYQQVVKAGETRRLAERVQQLDLAWTYDYAARLRSWQQQLEPTEIVVRRFERSSFDGGSLYQDFLTSAGLDIRAHELEEIAPVNESLDAESVEFLRVLNLLRLEDPEAATPLGRGNFGLTRRLAQASTGPTLTLPAAVLDDFMTQWDESNRLVARDFLADPSETLFHEPRRSDNTTVEQHLDPDRLDHFLAVLELPERVHAPLLTLVEREAKAH
jgi:hypothetical protein